MGTDLQTFYFKNWKIFFGVNEKKNTTILKIQTNNFQMDVGLQILHINDHEYISVTWSKLFFKHGCQNYVNIYF